MADNDLNLCEDVLDYFLDMKIRDFLILCTEKGVRISLVTSAISVCLYEMACKAMFDENK